MISAPIPHAQTQRRTLSCSSRPHQIHMQTCAQSGEQRQDLVPSFGSGSELLPMVQNNIVNHPFSLAGSRLTICCLPLGCGTPGLVPLDPSTIIADRLLPGTLAGLSLLPPTGPGLATGLSFCEIPVTGRWLCFVMPLYLPYSGYEFRANTSHEIRSETSSFCRKKERTAFLDAGKLCPVQACPHPLLISIWP